MMCPFCKKDKDRVIDSRSSNAGRSVRRRRECFACSRRFTTYEQVEEITLYVIKKDGRREVFNVEKIRRGILTACKKRPVPMEKIDNMVHKIEVDLHQNYDREVKCKTVGSMVARELRRVDHVAYVRFASVYREFKDVAEFMRELKPMLK